MYMSFALQASAIAANEPIHRVLLVLSGASHMDTTAVEAIKEWRQGYERTGIHFALIDPKPEIVTILHRSGCLNTGMQETCCTMLLYRTHDACAEITYVCFMRFLGCLS